MKFFIGLGGIGCRTLLDYLEHDSSPGGKEYLFVDTEWYGEEHLRHYLMPDAFDGTAARRNVGRNLVRYELVSGGLGAFFEPIRTAKSVELVFVLSSFGGFGGAALIPLIEHLEALAWGRLTDCRVVAFQEGSFASRGFPEALCRQFETNTIALTAELAALEAPSLPEDQRGGRSFCPGAKSFLIDTSQLDPADFWMQIDSPAQQLQAADRRALYSQRESGGGGRVFISYSSADQKVADHIADALEQAGLRPWIATRKIRPGSYARQIVQAIRSADVFLVLVSGSTSDSEHVKNEIDQAFGRIRDGLTILPFLMDGAYMDEDLRYYLSRQQMVSGKLPPLEERIRELIRLICDITGSAE